MKVTAFPAVLVVQGGRVWTWNGDRSYDKLVAFGLGGYVHCFCLFLYFEKRFFFKKNYFIIILVLKTLVVIDHCNRVARLLQPKQLHCTLEGNLFMF